MKTVGIIAEYNPFHNGHEYQLKKAKELTGADYCMVVMSGDFVQRGAPAVMDKYLRARSALMCGADLVIELPVPYACASAEYFAAGAVALLDRLGVADCLCFGRECGDMAILSEIADVLMSESDEFKNALRFYLKEGHSYPKARNHALCVAAPQLTEHMDVLNYPNNILALEYLKALRRRKSSIKPYTVARHVSGYHDTGLNASYSSALAIRESIAVTNNIDHIKAQVPDCVYKLLTEHYLKTFPVFPEDMSVMLNYKLLTENSDSCGFTRYFDIDKDFSDKIKKLLPDAVNYDILCDTLKSKDMTYTRVARNLLHILLNIYQSDIETFRSQDYVYYARLLGFRKNASALLGAIKETSSIPLISKLADAASCIRAAENTYSEAGLKMLGYDISASHIYSIMLQNKFKREFMNEYKEPMIII